MICTRVDRKAKQSTIATSSVIAIFTIVQRRSSRCSRNGFDVSLSGKSRNLKMPRNAMVRRSGPIEGEKSRARRRAQIPSVFASRISLLSIILRNSSALKARQSRIDSDSS